MSAALSDVVASLFGDLVDPEAFGKMMPDASSVHVPGVLVTARVAPRKKTPGATVVRKRTLTPEQRRERLETNIARTSNVVGLAAGAAGTVAAGRSYRAVRLGAAGGPVTTALARRLKVSPKTAAALATTGAAGALGLQSANVVGDAVTTRVLSRSSKDVNKGALGALVSGHLNRLHMLNHAHDPAKRWATYPKAPTTGPKHLRSGKLAAGPKTEQARAKAQARGADARLEQMKATAKAKPAGTPEQAAARAAEVAYGPAATAGKQTRGHLNEALSTTGGKVALGAGAAGLLYGREKKKQLDYAYGKSVGFEATGTFSKVDEDKRLAFGWANVSKINGQKVLDRQGDYIDIEDMEDAAYVYVMKSRVGGDMHRRRTGLTHEFGKDADGEPHKVADLVESIVFTPEKIAKMGLPDDFPQAWWVGFRYHDDEAWEEIKAGRRTGFSIHGKGIRKAMELEELYS